MNPLTSRIINRKKRISITFRQTRKKPCDCKFIEFCDWDRSGKMAIPKTNLDGQNLEDEYVSKVSVFKQKFSFIIFKFLGL